MGLERSLPVFNYIHPNFYFSPHITFQQIHSSKVRARFHTSRHNTTFEFVDALQPCIHPNTRYALFLPPAPAFCNQSSASHEFQNYHFMRDNITLLVIVHSRGIGALHSLLAMDFLKYLRRTSIARFCYHLMEIRSKKLVTKIHSWYYGGLYIFSSRNIIENPPNKRDANDTLFLSLKRSLYCKLNKFRIWIWKGHTSTHHFGSSDHTYYERCLLLR